MLGRLAARRGLKRAASADPRDGPSLFGDLGLRGFREKEEAFLRELRLPILRAFRTNDGIARRGRPWTHDPFRNALAPT